MRDDYISRKAVMESLTKEYNRKATRDNGGLRLAWIEKAVNDVPSVERPAAQRETGAWIRAIDEEGETYICSECATEFIHPDDELPKYCPECGAKMGEE